jgi:hypothetical protein
MLETVYSRRLNLLPPAKRRSPIMFRRIAFGEKVSPVFGFITAYFRPLFWVSSIEEAWFIAEMIASYVIRTDSVAPIGRKGKTASALPPSVNAFSYYFGSDSECSWTQPCFPKTFTPDELAA